MINIRKSKVHPTAAPTIIGRNEFGLCAASDAAMIDGVTVVVGGSTKISKKKLKY